VTRAARLAAVALGALVSWLSLTPQPPAPPGLPDRADLVAHFGMHGALSGALAVGWPGATARWAAAGAAVYLEVGQAQVPGRTFSLLDLVANGIGAAAGLGAGGALRRRLAGVGAGARG
jgi:VanZ family protein